MTEEVTAVIQELEDLEHDVDLLNKLTFAGVPGAVRADAMVRMARIRNKIDAFDATVIDGFERAREFQAEGHGSSIGWLKHHAGAKGPDAARRRRLSRRLRTLPVARAALVDGAISWEHVEVLAQYQRLLGERLFACIENVLVDAAVEQRFSDFVLTVDYVVQHIAPAATRDRAKQLEEDRWASSSRTTQGAGSIDAWMPPLQFTEWQAELDRLCEHEYQKDVAAARDDLGRRPLHSELPRTTRQRRVDAMHLMARRSAALADEDLGRSTYSLVMHGDTELIGQLVEAIRDWADENDVDLAAVDGNDIDPDEIDLSGIELGPNSLHELDDGTVVCVQTLLLALLTGTVRGILFDPEGEVLRFGRRYRLFPGPVGEALRAKQRRCAHPYGCDRRAPFLQSDHVHEHQDGGCTDIENGQLLCGVHNRWKTNQRGKPPGGGPFDEGQRRRGPLEGP